MKKRYKVELELVLDEENEAKVIDAARRAYLESGEAVQVSDDGDGSLREPSAEEFIDDALRAVMELVEINPFFKELGVEVDGIICTDPDYKPGEQPRKQDTAASQHPQTTPSATKEESSELDEFDPGVCLYCWPKGDFSIVHAATRREALVRLDEWAAAVPSLLVPMESCMIDFRLNDAGKIELAQFGEDTDQFIWESCYPELQATLQRELLALEEQNGEEFSEAAKERIRQAVRHERKRLWANQPLGPEARTELGRLMQKRNGMSGPVADYYVHGSEEGV
jgi:hypothetical protein